MANKVYRPGLAKKHPHPRKPKKEPKRGKLENGGLIDTKRFYGKVGKK